MYGAKVELSIKTLQSFKFLLFPTRLFLEVACARFRAINFTGLPPQNPEMLSLDRTVKMLLHIISTD